MIVNEAIESFKKANLTKTSALIPHSNRQSSTPYLLYGIANTGLLGIILYFNKATWKQLYLKQAYPLMAVSLLSLPLFFQLNQDIQKENMQILHEIQKLKQNI